MKKIILFAFISLVSFIPELYSISLEQYIAQHGKPQIKMSIIGASLDLSNKSLTDITNLQQLIPDIKKVQNLFLGNNKLKTLPGAVFNGLGDLKGLNLSRNLLTTLPANIFSGLHKLESLHLYNNLLRMLPEDVFSNLSKLRVLTLDNNKLKELPATIFSDLNNLETLTFANNQFNRLPKTLFSGLNKLDTLDLRDNSFDPDFIGDLRDMMHGIPGLVWLNNKDKDQALQERPFYFPTLQTLTEEEIAKNIELYRQQLDELPINILAGLPLPEQERSQLIREKVQRNIDLYAVDYLGELPLPQEEKVKLIIEKIPTDEKLKAQWVLTHQSELLRLTEDVLNQLPLTPQQRAAITAEKRRMGQ